MSQQTVLISGASSGIGLEFTKKLATKGYAVVLLVRSGARLEQIAEDIRTKFRRM